MIKNNAGAPAVTNGLVDAQSQIATTLANVDHRLTGVESTLDQIYRLLQGRPIDKEWYSTNETADLLGKSDFTVREKWCNQGRIECEKDPSSGKWRIPAREVNRLRNGGGLRQLGAPPVA